MTAPEPPAVPPLYWDGCQFYADAGKGTHYVDAPYEGRYAVMYLTSSGHWAHQGNVDELPEAVMRLNLPTDIAAGAVPDTGQARETGAESPCPCGPDLTGECIDIRPDCPRHGYDYSVSGMVTAPELARAWWDSLEGDRPFWESLDQSAQTGYVELAAKWIQRACRNTADGASGDTVQAPESPTDSTPTAGRGGSSEAETATGAVQAPDVTALALADRLTSRAEVIRPREDRDDLDQVNVEDIHEHGYHTGVADALKQVADEIRRLLGADTTPDRLAWIDTAAETAAAERQARYQETACARRPAEATPDV